MGVSLIYHISTMLLFKNTKASQFWNISGPRISGEDHWPVIPYQTIYPKKLSWNAEKNIGSLVLIPEVLILLIIIDSINYPIGFCK